jgi:hypothetical protein
MPDPIAFPDAEAAIIPHLRDQLVALGMPVPVSGKVPNPVPARHVRVVRTGGLRSNLVMDRARLTFECRDSSGEPGAAALARLVRAIVTNAPGYMGGAWVDVAAEVGGPASSPDPDTGTPRYLLTVELHIRGSEL